jgi:hypothetical protein
MTPELFCFFSSILCALLTMLIEIRHGDGALLSMAESIVDKVYPVIATEDPQDIV